MCRRDLFRLAASPPAGKQTFLPTNPWRADLSFVIINGRLSSSSPPGEGRRKARGELETEEGKLSILPRSTNKERTLKYFCSDF